ncbi:MAG: prepilin-type N-terminal cleavage/methylation domain-containing protein [Bacillota bacterium]
MRNKKGFTLIELLVVIAIIGLLSTLSVLALNSARARSRDAKRIADVKQMQTALEMYYNDNNDYPATSPGLAALASTTPPLLRVVPKAPLPADGTCTDADGSNRYVYARQAGASGQGSASYTLTYCLGADTGNVESGPQTASPAGVASVLK